MAGVSILRSVVFGVFIASSGFAFACCGASAPYVDVRFGYQRNIVVWEPEKQTEHFIRVAEFESDADKFGFLAPTPTVPKLSLVDPASYRLLRSIENSILNPSQMRGARSATAGDGGEAPGFDVVQDVEIGDYRARTIRASDADALTQYLSDEGFSLAPDAEEWIAHYVEKEWLITAFRVEKKDAGLQTGSICMSFKTESPFNPAYVPESNLGDEMAGFHLYFVSPTAAIAGRIGDRRVKSSLQFKLGRYSEQLQKWLADSGVGSLEDYSVSVIDQRFNGEDRDDLIFTEYEWPAWFPTPPSSSSAPDPLDARGLFSRLFNPRYDLKWLRLI